MSSHSFLPALRPSRRHLLLGGAALGLSSAAGWGSSPLAAADSGLLGRRPSSISLVYGPATVAQLVEVRFSWLTTPEVGGTVVEWARAQTYAQNGRFLFNKTGRAETVDIGVATSAVVTSHQVEVTNLQPDTEYVYRVGDGAGAWSDPVHFTTRRRNPDAFTFHWFTDTQQSTRERYQDRLVDAYRHAFAENPRPDFIVHSGDQVNDSYKTDQWDWFFEASQPWFSSTPVVPLIGNHEYEGNPRDGYSDWRSPDPYFRNFAARFNVPRNGPSFTGAQGGLPTAVGDPGRHLEHSAYHFTYGNALFLVLNHFDQIYRHPDSVKAQLDWMRTVRQSSTAKWTIVIYHHGLYLGRRSNPSRYKEIAAVFDEVGVDLALSGHDHMYLRTYPMRGNQPVAEGQGTVYITGASGGEGTGYAYDPSRNARTTALVVDQKQASYQTVTVTPDSIRVIGRFRDPVTRQYGTADDYTHRSKVPANLGQWVPPVSPVA